MKILEKLNIISTRPSLIVLSGCANSGKTSLLISITKELLCNGNRVLFITDNLSEVTDTLSDEKLKLYSHNLVLIENKYGNSLKEIMGQHKYNYVIIDSIYFVLTKGNEDYLTKNDNFIDEVKEYSESYKTSFLISNNTRCLIESNKNIFVNSGKTSYIVDYIFIISKLDKYYLTLLDKIKFLFPFIWKKPNILIRVIKNRYGRLRIFYAHMDFKNSNINFYK